MADLTLRTRLPFDVTAGWTPTNCTLDFDTDNCWSKVLNPNGNLRVTHTTGEDPAVIEFAFDPVIDLKHCLGMLALYIPPGSGTTDPAQITEIIISFRSGGDWTNYKRGTFQRSRGPSGVAATGWQVTWTSEALRWTVGTLPWPDDLDMTQVDAVRITFTQSVNTQVVPITFGQFAWYVKPAKPRVAITLDDEFDTQPAMAAYMAAKGIFGTFYVCTKYVGDPNPSPFAPNGGGHATVAELLAMQAAGHLIANHTWSHGWGYAMTDAQELAEFIQARDWLDANGFTGSRHLAIPGGTGSFSQTDKDWLNPYIDSNRLGALPGPTGAVGAVSPGYGWPYHPIGISDPPSVAAGISITDKAIAGGYDVVFLFHGANVGTGEPDPAVFEGIIDYIAVKEAAGLLETVLISDLVETPPDKNWDEVNYDRRYGRVTVPEGETFALDQDLWAEALTVAGTFDLNGYTLYLRPSADDWLIGEIGGTGSVNIHFLDQTYHQNTTLTLAGWDVDFASAVIIGVGSVSIIGTNAASIKNTAALIQNMTINNVDASGTNELHGYHAAGNQWGHHVGAPAGDDATKNCTLAGTNTNVRLIRARGRRGRSHPVHGRRTLAAPRIAA